MNSCMEERRCCPQCHSSIVKGGSSDKAEPPPQSPRTISILGLFELSVGARPRPDGRSELAAARLAVSHVNRRNLLPGYALTLVTNDTKCDPGVGVDRLIHALYAPRAARMLMLL
ncbi:unnamed protein product [Plutella xylostella]|uniref:(diamondback moth) hypothetical protein n=1 Tax=Plutella xylostella TaxID=51655 RepID=A0A8S4FMG2_PLUXY|nr:unnamed protein product [Plutella xylostella]